MENVAANTDPPRVRCERCGSKLKYSDGRGRFYTHCRNKDCVCNGVYSHDPELKGLLWWLSLKLGYRLPFTKSKREKLGVRSRRN